MQGFQAVSDEKKAATTAIRKFLAEMVGTDDVPFVILYQSQSTCETLDIDILTNLSGEDAIGMISMIADATQNPS